MGFTPAEHGQVRGRNRGVTSGGSDVVSRGERTTKRPFLELIQLPDNWRILFTRTRRRGLLAAGLGLVGLLTLTGAKGCAPDNASADDQPKPTPIELDVLPDKLPEPVRKAQFAAVRVKIDFDDGTFSSGSGVKIEHGDPAKTFILTAGHGFRQPDGQLIPLATCFDRGNIKIEARNSAKRAIQSPIARGVSTFTRDSRTIPDVAILEAEENLSTLPALKVRSTPLAADEVVYFITFEPAMVDTNGKKQLLQRTPLSSDAKLQTPAIYAGIATGFTTGADQTVIITGINDGYSEGLPQNASRGGASGGMIVDANGDIVAIVTTTTSVDPEGNIHPIPAYFIQKDYNVSLSGTNVDKRFLSITISQKVSPALVGTMTERLKSDPDKCAPQN